MRNDKLTPREIEILCHVATGLTDRQIAACLHLSPRTVSNAVASILLKLSASTRTEAAMRAVQEGIVKQATHLE